MSPLSRRGGRTHTLCWRTYILRSDVSTPEKKAFLDQAYLGLGAASGSVGARQSRRLSTRTNLPASNLSFESKALFVGTEKVKATTCPSKSEKRSQEQEKVTPPADELQRHVLKETRIEREMLMVGYGRTHGV